MSGSILTLILLVSFAHIVLADDNSDGVISRPEIEYSSGDLRDPFRDLFELEMLKAKKEKEEQNIQEPVDSTEPQKPLPSLDKIKVQGVMWGGKFPQAIINNKILGVGDSVEGGVIVSIEKKGITLNFSGRIAILDIPGSASTLKKGNKEEK